MAEEAKKEITYFAQTNFRNQLRKFGIKRRDRSRHFYIIGKTGTGKTTLIENMVAQDIMNGEGVGIIDPHGEFAEKMLKFVPKERIEDVVYLAPHDMDFPISFNVLEEVGPEQRSMVRDGLMSVFKKIWPDAFSGRMEYLLSNAILALLEVPSSTLLGINRIFGDKEYRNWVVSQVTDSSVKAFWVDEFGKYDEKYAREASAAIQNKIGQFISNPLIRNIIGQPKTSFDIRDIMDKKKILIMNLSKGRIGEESSRLIGAMLITKIYLAAMARIDIPEAERNDFNLYVDEFQNFAVESFANILSEARKYRLNLTLAHQYIAQMDEKVRDAVIGNVGSMVVFRVGADDAEFLEKEFEPSFIVQDLVNLGFAHIYLKLMIDGFTSKPFSATTLPPISAQKESNVEAIIKFSREKYAVPKDKAEEQINEWYKPITLERKEGEMPKGHSINRTSRSLPHAVVGGGESDKPQSYPASCVSCNKRIYVPFEPDGKKPLYCKEHMPVSGEGRGVRGARTPSFDEGQVVAKSFGSAGAGEAVRTISLRDLEDKRKKGSESDELKKLLEEIKSGQAKKESPKEEPEAKKEKPEESPKITEPKETEVVAPEAKEEPAPGVNKGKLKPGQKIRFD